MTDALNVPGGLSTGSTALGAPAQHDTPVDKPWLVALGASAGGFLVAADGTPDVNSTNATLGLRWLAGGVKDSSIPPDALNWNEESARQAFLDGRILFLRDWSDAESAVSATVRAQGPGWSSEDAIAITP